MHAWSGWFQADRRIRLVLAALTVLAIAASLLFARPLPPASADDTGVGGVGGDVYPLANNDIRLQAETVQAICFGGFAEYRVDFEFVNEGKTQTVKLGFPFAVTKSDNKGTAPADFRAWQDGRPLTVTIGREVSSQNLNETTGVGYYLHEATFPPGKAMITVAYVAAPSSEAGARTVGLEPKAFADAGLAGFCADYYYWLHTGAGWRDTIGKAVVRYTLADSFAGWAVDVPPEPGQPNDYITSPAPYAKLDDRTYQWVFEDFEPTENDDIELAYSDPVLPYSDPTTQDNDVPAGMGAVTEVEAVSGDARPLSEDGTPEWEPGLFGSAWGAPAPGAGGWIRLSIKGNRGIKEFRILPGRLDSLTSFKEYGRPKTVRVTLSDGTSSDFKLADDPSLQSFPIKGTATEATIKILDVYPGTKSRDTYISHIEFGNETAPTFEPFAKLITEQALPPTTTSSSSAEPTSTTAQPTTPSPPSTSVAATSLTTAVGSKAPNLGRTGRLLWPAWLGLGVGIVGLAALAFFVIRLRRRARS